MVTRSGKCIKCPAYTKAAEHGMSCVLPKCNSREIFTSDGKC